MNRVVTEVQRTERGRDYWKRYFTATSPDELELGKRCAKEYPHDEDAFQYRVARIEYLTDEKGEYHEPNATKLEAFVAKIANLLEKDYAVAILIRWDELLEEARALLNGNVPPPEQET